MAGQLSCNNEHRVSSLRLSVLLHDTHLHDEKFHNNKLTGWDNFQSLLGITWPPTLTSHPKEILTVREMWPTEIFENKTNMQNNTTPAYLKNIGHCCFTLLWRGTWLRLRPVIELRWRGCRRLVPASHTSGQTQSELFKSARPCWMSGPVWSQE